MSKRARNGFHGVRNRRRRSRRANGRPIKAAFLTPGLLLGGAERWLVSLVKYCNPARVRWTGVAISSAGGADSSLCRELARHTELHCQRRSTNGRTPTLPFEERYFDRVHRSWSRAVRQVSKRADVVLAWGAPDFVNCVPNKECPIVLVSHSTEKEDPPQPVNPGVHLAAVSEAAAAFFRSRRGAKRPVAVIYNGADRSRCRPYRGRAWQRQAWGLGPRDVSVGYVGRQSDEKNYMAAARAVAELPRRYKAIYYGSAVGHPKKPTAELRDFAERHPSRVLLHPPKPFIGGVLSGLDVFVLASHREAFSLGLIEAWLAGVPVVATPVGSIPELQQQHGPLVVEVPLDPSPKQVAEAVCRAHGSEGRGIAQRAQQLARRHFTCEAMTERWMSYLEHLVNPHYA